MSKIICEVCGTVYPETSAQCPICGCVRSGDTAVAIPAASTEEADKKTYTYVKGGRFSKANVKKRNRSQQTVAERSVASGDNGRVDHSRVDRGLTITVIFLLIAIVAVVVYIVVNFFGIGIPTPSEPPVNQTTNSTVSTQPSTTQTGSLTTKPEETTVPCQSLKLDDTTVTLENPGEAVLLNVYAEPSNTTDTITFMSADESVATVTASGKVVAVAGGETVITIKCGEVEIQCKVVCNIPEPTTEPVTEPSTATEPDSDFALNRSDFTLSTKGESWVLYNGTIGKTEITWSSEDESIATVEGGKVIAVGPGVTKVYAEYNGTVLSCIVRCSFTVESDPVINGNGGVSEDGGTLTGSFSISHSDVTIAVGESFNLTLKDSAGKTVDVTWHIDESKYCSITGNRITGEASGIAKVYTTYDGSEYSCIVRVTG